MSIIEKAIVFGAVAAGVGALGYYGGDIAKNINEMEALPEAVRKALGSGFEYASGSINKVGNIVADTIGSSTKLQPEALIADERLRTAVTAGLTLLGATALGATLLGAVSNNEHVAPGVPPSGPQNGPNRYN